MKRTIIFVVAIAVAFVLGWMLAPQSTIVEERVVIDTVFYAKPTIAKVEARPTSVRVPQLIFAERIVEVSKDVMPTTIEQDSTDIIVDMETIIYEDSTYKAQVTGPAIGNLHPSLDWVHTYQKTITQTVTKKSRFAVTAGAGVGLTPTGNIQPTIGVSAGIILWQK